MPRRSVGVGNRLRCERTYAVVGGGRPHVGLRIRARCRNYKLAAAAVACEAPARREGLVF